MATQLTSVPDEHASGASLGGKRPPVLLYVVNVAWFFCLHRLHLALAARDAGFVVHVATAPDFAEHVQQITAQGLIFHPLKLRRGRWSVLEECRLAASLGVLYREIRPDIVHHVTIKPVLCGTLAARLLAVPAVVNSVSGLGFVYTATDKWAGWRRRTVELAYKGLLAGASIRVIFENGDDLKLFVDRGIIEAKNAVLIRGVGVDLERFRLAPPRSGVPLIVLPARMLWDKGVGEFCAAAATLRAAGIEARFVLVGGLDDENPAAIPASWLREQQREGAVEWWGQQHDMVAVYAAAHVVCLPSYREGLPTVLLEGAACGCALVTTDVPGCREVVRDGDTGLLVPSRDPAALAQALRAVIVDQGLRTRLSESARARVVAEFSAQEVRDSTNKLYRGLLGASH
jgi:glycosyltransferase involved in cell wall biosynthesis